MKSTDHSDTFVLISMYVCMYVCMCVCSVELRGVVGHSGTSLQRGHYMTLRRSQSAAVATQWIHLDDSKVATVSSLEEGLHMLGHCTLFCYEKCVPDNNPKPTS